MNLKNKKVVLLDLDNTLYRYQLCNQVGVKAIVSFLAEHYSLDRTKIKKTFDQARKQVKKNIPDTGSSHSRLLYLQRTIELLVGKIDPQLNLDTVNLFWDTYFKTMKLRSGARQFLRLLRQKKFKTVIVSDHLASIQLQKLITLKIDKYIDLIVTSEESGQDKPSPNSFLLALEKTRASPKQAVMIGDSLPKDIEGAHKLKIDAIHFCPQGEEKRCRHSLTIPVVKSFRELIQFFSFDK